MIRHIVFFTCTDENRKSVLDGLSLLTQIKHADVLEIVENAKLDLYGNDVDVIVYGEFKDEDAFHAYKNDPLYAQATNTVKPLRETRIAADFDTQKVYRSN